MEDNNCKICGNSKNNHSLTVREMLFGTREAFEYFQCADCGCLQIAKIPENMARHYPANEYYSYNMQVKTSKTRDFFHKLLFYGYKTRLLPANFKYLRAFDALPSIKNIKYNAAILDIGCGDGRLIQDMRVWGWKNLTGIDPFIEKNIIYPSGVKILKQDIFGHNGQYDFIMMNHSLEHMDRQKEVFERLNQLLAPNGRLLIRIPVADCYVLRKYGAYAHQIDAPRHFFLHTKRSIFLLANHAGFAMEKIEYESNAYQFVHSEKYIRNIKRYDKFKISTGRLKKLQKISKSLNIMHDGDMACFILKKAN